MILPEADLGERSLAFVVPEGLNVQIKEWYDHPFSSQQPDDRYDASAHEYQWTWTDNNFVNDYLVTQQSLLLGKDWNSPTAGQWNYTDDQETVWSRLDVPTQSAQRETDFLARFNSLIDFADRQQTQQWGKLLDPLSESLDSIEDYEYLLGAGVAARPEDVDTGDSVLNRHLDLSELSTEDLKALVVAGLAEVSTQDVGTLTNIDAFDAGYGEEEVRIAVVQFPSDTATGQTDTRRHIYRFIPYQARQTTLSNLSVYIIPAVSAHWERIGIEAGTNSFDVTISETFKTLEAEGAIDRVEVRLAWIPFLRAAAAESFTDGAGMVAFDAFGGVLIRGAGTALRVSVNSVRTTSRNFKAARLIAKRRGVSTISILVKGKKVVPNVIPKTGLTVPQGLTANQFSRAQTLIRDTLGDLADDVVVQGSRARGTARATSDIDFGLRVSPREFSNAVRRAFPSNPGPFSASGRTMIDAIFRGRIFRRQARLPNGDKLRSLAVQLEDLLKIKVDFSIIERGGLFDQLPIIPLR